MQSGVVSPTNTPRFKYPAMHALRVVRDGEADEPTNTPYSILPALAFSLDMFSKTEMSFGVNEVLLSSVLGSVVFSIFAAQPLVIVGVTGMVSSRRALALESDSLNRAYYCLQLYRLRHHHTKGDELFRFHVLDRLVFYSSTLLKAPAADICEGGHCLCTGSWPLPTPATG